MIVVSEGRTDRWETPAARNRNRRSPSRRSIGKLQPGLHGQQQLDNSASCGFLRLPPGLSQAVFACICFLWTLCRAKAGSCPMCG
eukprot:14510704-Alexandrium_andersonii.AAC.1